MTNMNRFHLPVSVERNSRYRNTLGIGTLTLIQKQFVNLLYQIDNRCNYTLGTQNVINNKNNNNDLTRMHFVWCTFYNK